MAEFEACVSFISFIVSAFIFLFFAFSVKKPTCSIQEFYVPGLNKPTNTTTAPTNTLFFDLKLHNKNVAKGVKYAPINLTFYFGPNKNFPVGNYIVPGFYQGIKKDTNRRQLVYLHDVPWKAAIGEVSNGSSVIFHVGLATSVRFKFLGVYHRKHKMVIGANVEVDYSGEKVDSDGIKLKSGANLAIPRSWMSGLFALVIVIVFLF